MHRRRRGPNPGSLPGCVTYYLLNFTSKGADKSRSLREQATQLLDAGMWGIGDKTANRNQLAPGDEVLAYVGAPERAFVGHGRLSSSTHLWSPAEVARYPGSFPAGVTFGEAVSWDQPVPLRSVWEEMPSAEKNPRAQFFGGVVRLREGDFKRVLAERPDLLPKPKPPASNYGDTPAGPVLPAPRSGDTLSGPGTLALDRLYQAAQRLQAFLSNPRPLSEDATRAQFINKYIEALGYTDFSDVDYGVPVDSGDFADYVLQPSGKPAVVVEAKKLGATVGAKEAAQVVKYASVLGLRWGVVTDGRYLKLYDARVPQVAPEDRLVFELDLAGYKDREDFEVLLASDLMLLSKESVEADTPLEERAAREGVREILTFPGSTTVKELRGELKKRKLVHLDEGQLTDLLSDLLS